MRAPALVLVLLVGGCTSGEERSAAPTPAPSSTPAPTASPAPVPTTACGPIGADCRNGRPGWSGGFSGCQQARADARAPRSFELGPGVTATLQAPATGEVGRPVGVQVVLRNDTGKTVQVDVSEGLSTGAGIAGASGASGREWTDVGMVQSVLIGAHRTEVRSYVVSTKACGDSRADERPVLPAGDYTLTVDGLFALRGGASVATLSVPFRLV